MKYKISYTIAQTRHTKGTQSAKIEVNKQDLADWIAWLNYKRATYTITTL